MSASQDYVALDWIKGEIGTTLDQARDALESVAEAPDDTARMRPCLTALHQVHGTLKMVELEGPTSVALEMEQLAQSLMNNSVPDVNEAQESLMRSILQMPAYLDKIQREQADSEANYLPIINNLRSARGEEPIAGEAPADTGGDAGPDFTLLSAAPADDVIAAFESGNGPQNIQKLRARFQQSLVAIAKKTDTRENIGMLAKVFSAIAKLCGESPMGYLSQLSVALAEAIGQGAIKLSNASLGQFKAIDAELKKLVTGGAAGLSEPVDAAIAEGILALFETASKETPRMQATKALFAGAPAGVPIPTSFGIGPDDETIATVSKIIIEELNSVTDRLDLFVRANVSNPEALLELLPNLEQIASTLTIVGMDSHQNSVLRQIAQIKAVEESGEAPDEETLLEMAKDLLGIEADLGTLTGDNEDGEGETFGDIESAEAAVIRETRNGLATCKDGVIEFVASNYDLSKVEDLPQTLTALRGGLLIANQQRAGDLLVAAGSFIQTALIDGSKEPEFEDMDNLADAITSVDYFLERLQENPNEPYLQMLDVAEEAIARLVAEPSSEQEVPVEAETVPDDTAGSDLESDSVEEDAALADAVEVESVEDEPDSDLTEIAAVVADEALEPDDSQESSEETVTTAVDEASEGLSSPETLETEVAADDVTPEAIEEIEETEAVAQEPTLEPAAAEPAAPEQAAPEEVTPEAPVDDEDSLIDEEILEIFVEEVDEVLETINEYFPQWRADPGNEDARTEVRRAFHTLKGSGRMVGATVLGELAWSVENMLNRAIDGTISISDDMMALIEEVVATVPEGMERFKSNEQHLYDVDLLVSRAEAISAGEVLPAATTEAPEADDPAASDEDEALISATDELNVETEEALTLSLDADDDAPELEEVDSIGADEFDAEVLESGEDTLELNQTETDEGFSLSEVDADTLSLADDELSDLELSDDSAEVLEVDAADAVETQDISVELDVEDEPTFSLESFDEVEDDAIVDVSEVSLEANEPQDTVTTAGDDNTDALTLEPLAEADGDFTLDEETALDADVAAEIASDDELLSLVDVDDDSLEFESVDEVSAAPDEGSEADEDPDSEFTLESVEEDDFGLEVVEEVAEEVAAEETIEPTPGMEASEAVATTDLELAEDDSFDFETVDEADDEAVDSDTLSLDALDVADPDSDVEWSVDTVDDQSEGAEDVAVTLDESLALDDEGIEEFDDSLSLDDSEFEFDAVDTEEAPAGAEEALPTIAADDFELSLTDEPGFASADEDEGEEAEIAALESEDDEFSLGDIDEDVLEDIADVAAVVAPQVGLEAEPEPEPVSELDEVEEIFAEEAAEKLAVIRQYLGTGGPMTGDVVAAYHTLKGSGAMANVQGVSDLAAPMEHLTNQYLASNSDADQELLELITESVAVIQAIVEDIPQLREGVHGQESLIARVEATLTSTEGQASFDFSPIHVLSKADVADSVSDGSTREQVITELAHTREEAARVGQGEVEILAESLTRIYRETTGELSETAAETLKEGHRVLVEMFDRLASAQEVAGAADIVLQLDNLDLTPPTVPDTTEDIAAVEPEAIAETPGNAGSELPADDIDEDILPIFLEETEELLEGIDQSILEWSNDTTSFDHLDLLLRHLHTLKGGARMAGINSLGEFTHNFETFLIGVRSHPVDFDETFFARVNQHQDEITRRVEIYQKLAMGQAAEAELASMRFDLPEAGASAAPAVEAPAETPAAVEPEPLATSPVAGMPVAGMPAAGSPAAGSPAAETPASETITLPDDDVDEDILPIFLEETEELLEGIDGCIQDWSENPAGSEPLDILLRHLHTLKGGARMAGLNSLGEYAHNFETYLISVQQNPIELDAGFFGLLNGHQDEITRRVEIYQRLAQGEASEEELQSLTSSAPVTKASGAATSTEAVSGQQAAAEIAAPSEAEEDKGPATQTQQAEMVRVSADLLEELIGLSGESSITRGRVEQQISDFSEAIEEMESTIGRIREQVRRLEIEAESRETLIRSQEPGADSAFDELEMDRYTMLQEISRTLSESSSDMMDLKETLLNRSRDAETLLHQQARIASELQEGLTRTRMVPFARLIPRLRRIVRQISGEVGKSVRFDAFNVEGELDRSVLERIVAPLEHMLRNAVDHGIEETEARVASGKPEQGRISLRLSREGGYVVLNVSDDGGGIRVDAVRNKALERGLMTEDSPLSDHEIMQFILHAGFSTAQKLTQISGRGVGMDVVSSEIKSLGGTITIDSQVGVGTEFTIRIPFTVSINRALMVVVREETYAIPLNTIEGIVRVSPYELEAYYQPDAPMFEYAGQPYQLDYMGKVLEKSETPNLSGQIAPLPVILARSGDHSVALQVDRVIGSREVVVKTLGAQFNEVGGVAGATVMGDGSVVIILDVMALVRTHDMALIQTGETPAETEPEPDMTAANRVRTVMIVDDSVTVRKVTSRLMERQGWEVATAKDGIDAVNQLQDIYPDIVLLDIEMPRMDGFEVLRNVRRDDRLKNLPIIMITSRTGEKHKEQALELGVNRYLGKPFQEASLLSNIEEVIAEATASQKSS